MSETNPVCPHCGAAYKKTEENEIFFNCGTTELAGSFMRYTRREELCLVREELERVKNLARKVERDLGATVYGLRRAIEIAHELDTGRALGDTPEDLRKREQLYAQLQEIQESIPEV